MMLVLTSFGTIQRHSLSFPIECLSYRTQALLRLLLGSEGNLTPHAQSAFLNSYFAIGSSPLALIAATAALELR
jgi:hypothetical protein